MSLTANLIFMSSYKGLGPNKQFWPIRMKLRKPFPRHRFHYPENFLHELLSNIHQVNCSTPVGPTKIIPLTCCVISLSQYTSFAEGACILSLWSIFLVFVQLNLFALMMLFFLCGFLGIAAQ